MAFEEAFLVTFILKFRTFKQFLGIFTSIYIGKRRLIADPIVKLRGVYSTFNPLMAHFFVKFA